MDKTIKVIKDINPNTLIMIKIGSFYHTYGKDAYLLAYLFNYQLKSSENTYNTCGFPISAACKVTKCLEDNKISYMQINKSENYEVENEVSFKSENQYFEMYERAYKYISKRNRINAIYTYLKDNIEAESIRFKLRDIEEILYES